MINTPYLTLGDRISQAWLNKYTIALILAAIKLIMFQISLQESINLAREYTLSSCPTIDSYASNALSLPHYLSKSANYMIEKSVQEINEKTLETLKMVLTASENMIIFAINMVVGTYACVLVSTVDGAVDVAVNGTETVIQYVNKTLGTITDDIEDGLKDVSSVLNKLIGAGEKVKDFFTGGSSSSNSKESLHKFNLTVSSLKKLSIPASINTKLKSLKENVPDFVTVQDKTENLIKEPFELVKAKISNSTVFSNNGNNLFVPELKQITICSANSDQINQFYIDVAKDMKIMVKIFVCSLLVGSILIVIPIIWEECRAWRKLQSLENKLHDITRTHTEKQQQQMSQQFTTDPNQEKKPQTPTNMLLTDQIDAFNQTFNRYTTLIGINSSKVISTKPHTRLRVRWLFAYILSQRAVILIGLALLGILVVVLQFIILYSFSRAVKNHDFPFGPVSDALVADFDASISNWTNSTNTYLSQKETAINEDMLGWVRTATETVNTTITAVVDDLNEVIAKAFNGTILYAPVKSIVGCVITNKLEKIEKGLTWAHDKAHVELPRVNDGCLLKAFDSSFSSSSTDLERYSSKIRAQDSGGEIVNKVAEMISTTQDTMSKTFQTIIKKYMTSLGLELWISLVLFGVWAFQLIVALIVIYLDQHRFKIQQKDDSKHKFNANEVKISYPKELAKSQELELGYPYKCSFGRDNLYDTNCSKENLSPDMDNHQYQHPRKQYNQNPLRFNAPQPRQASIFLANPFDEQFDDTTCHDQHRERYPSPGIDRFSIVSNPFDLNDDDLSVLELKSSNEINELNYKRNIV